MMINFIDLNHGFDQDVRRSLLLHSFRFFYANLTFHCSSVSKMFKIGLLESNFSFFLQMFEATTVQLMVQANVRFLGVND